MKKVFIVGGDVLIYRMFNERGWEVINNPHDADLLQFVGGEDVDPSLYGEERHATTYSNPKRDSFESHIFRGADGVACAGICRGGQFLNVMMGGKLWQDVDNHAISDTHIVFNEKNPWQYYQVTSTHHQMMIPNYEKNPDVWVAFESTNRESATEVNEDINFSDVEILVYKNYGVLCYQPHPEFVDYDHECQELYFNLLEEIL